MAPIISKKSAFRVVPVLDLGRGRALHARGGRRASYRAVAGAFGTGDDPARLAARLRDAFGFTHAYAADLDALNGLAPQWPLLGSLAATGLKVWADAGVRDEADLPPPGVFEPDAWVAATETLRGADALCSLAARVSPGSLIFGLDLRDGKPLTAPGSGLDGLEPLALVGLAAGAGVGRVLALDLSRVGSGRGVGTEDLARAVKARFPGVELFIGGGVRTLDDLTRARDSGADGVLVASALHDGTIRPEDLARWAEWGERGK